jgi:hypothetical protein
MAMTMPMRNISKSSANDFDSASSRYHSYYHHQHQKQQQQQQDVNFAAENGTTETATIRALSLSVLGHIAVLEQCCCHTDAGGGVGVGVVTTACRDIDRSWYCLSVFGVNGSLIASRQFGSKSKQAGRGRGLAPTGTATAAAERECASAAVMGTSSATTADTHSLLHCHDSSIVATSEAVIPHLYWTRDGRHILIATIVAEYSLPRANAASGVDIHTKDPTGSISNSSSGPSKVSTQHPPTPTRTSRVQLLCGNSLGLQRELWSHVSKCQNGMTGIGSNQTLHDHRPSPSGRHDKDIVSVFSVSPDERCIVIGMSSGALYCCAVHFGLSLQDPDPDPVPPM